MTKRQNDKQLQKGFYAKKRGRNVKQSGSRTWRKQIYARMHTRKHLYESMLILLVAAIVFAYFIANTTKNAETPRPSWEAELGQSALSVCFIDVGQGDSILLTSDGAAVLIDTGEESYSDEVIRQISGRGITRLDALIGTHPHSDHIGGMDKVIDAFEIGALYMSRAINNTIQFEEVIRAAASKGLRFTAPRSGDTLELAGGLSLFFLGPVLEDDHDLNNSSIIVKAVYTVDDTFGNTGSGKQEYSFLFPADAESLAESILLGSDYELKADVMKVGHHGSATSTIPDFLTAINPAYAVIQCGSGNPYGHPAASVLDLFGERNVKLLRTDILGSIAFYITADDMGEGGGFTVITERGGYINE